jgi:apolipoprotein N-acyltransferase
MMALTVWKRVALAWGAGLLSALAFPPFNALFLLWLSFPVLALLLAQATRDREAFWIGWAFAFGQLLISFYWIAGALFVDIKAFWWVLPFALCGLPAFLSIYYGLFAIMARRWSGRGLDFLIVVALGWFFADMLRGHLLTGFPWDILGYVWADHLPMMQSVRELGVEGLSLLTALLAVLPAGFFLKDMTRRQTFGAVIVAILLATGLYGLGVIRLRQAPQEFVPDVMLRLVQPQMDQVSKWDPQQKARDLEKLIRLSIEPTQGVKPTHVLWPETASAYYLAEEPEIRRMIAARLPKDAVLLTGSVRRQFDEAGELRYYNSLIAMDARGTIVAGYDKHHLVPFGEYMPFADIIPLKLVSMMGKPFTAGEGVRTIRVPGLPPLSGLVCYEAIFQGGVVEAADRPALLVNVTNDAWYKGTIGPAQHFLIARARAIEEGLPLVRIANQGKTAVIDPYGRVVKAIGYDRAGFVDSPLPKAIEETGTSDPLWKRDVSWMLVLLLLLSAGKIHYSRIATRRDS